MNKMIKKIVITMMIIGMVGTGFTMVEAASPTDTLPTPVATPNKKTARIGEEITIDVAGLNYETASNDKMRDDYRFEFYTEAYNEAYQIKDIKLPMIRSNDVDVDYIEVYFMTVYSGGRDWIVDPIKLIPGETESIVYTREQIMNWVENKSTTGAMPETMYFLFQPIKDGNVVSSSSMVFDGPIQFTYNIVDASTYFSSNSFGWFQGKTSIVYDSSDYQESSRLESGVNIYQYFETSNISVVASKSMDLIPGEEIDLTFTIENTATINNRLLWLGMEANGLELVGDDTDLVWSNVGDKNMVASIHQNGAWIRIDGGTSYTLTRRFKVKDTYTEANIAVNPYLFIDGDYGNREVDPGINLTLYQSQKYAITYDMNDGTGSTLRDEQEYSIEENATLLNQEMIRDGYTFVGWNTRADGSGTLYNAGSVVGIEGLIPLQKATQGITMYGTWEKVEVTTPEKEKPGQVIQAESSSVNPPNTGDGTNAISFLMLATGALIAMLYVAKQRRNS